MSLSHPVTHADLAAGDEMAGPAAHVTVAVVCPMHDGACGQPVVANFGAFADVTVSVQPCDALLRQGWDGPQWVGRKSYASVVLVPVHAAERPVRHAAGLVVFG